MAVAIGIGMLAGMEREWSNKDVGVRTFAIVALLGMLASLIGPSVAIASLFGVFLLVAAKNTRSILSDRSLEVTTSAALMLNYPRERKTPHLGEGISATWQPRHRGSLLLLNVRFQDVDWGSTIRRSEVRWGPQEAFPVASHKVRPLQSHREPKGQEGSSLAPGLSR